MEHTKLLMPRAPSAMEWLKHAFAVETPAEEWTERHLEVADSVCAAIVRRRMTAPVLLFLESGRPLNFLASQLLVFLTPFVSAITDAQGTKLFAEFLERRESTEYLCRKLEELSSGESSTDDSATGETPPTD